MEVVDRFPHGWQIVRQRRGAREVIVLLLADRERRVRGAEQDDDAHHDRQKATVHYVIPTSLLSPSMKR